MGAYEEVEYLTKEVQGYKPKEKEYEELAFVTTIVTTAFRLP